MLRNAVASRRDFMLGASALLASAAIPAFSARRAYAAAPKTPVQMPGVQRFTVGEIEVTALLDGAFPLDAAMVPQAVPEEVDRLLAAGHLPAGKPVPTPISAYLVNTGGRMILVDTGADGTFGDAFPGLGQVPANLAAAGIAPDQVDAVFLTHMHADHIGGLTGADGAPAFPKAELHVSKADWDFWMSEEIMNAAPEAARFWWQIAQAKAAPYRDRVVLHGDGDDLGGGVTLHAAPGHTPGHTGVRLSSGSDQLLIWGDIIHASALQFAHPEWAVVFDVDQAQAIATRTKVLDMVATDGLRVAGMHLPFPGSGYVERAGAGFAYTPARWQYTL